LQYIIFYNKKIFLLMDFFKNFHASEMCLNLTDSERYNQQFNVSFITMNSIIIIVMHYFFIYELCDSRHFGNKI